MNGFEIFGRIIFFIVVALFVYGIVSMIWSDIIRKYHRKKRAKVLLDMLCLDTGLSDRARQYLFRVREDLKSDFYNQ
tara:strand:- start:31 stop:261 length:231 start_codon:yes stop_codon:yes gene_type:complete